MTHIPNIYQMYIENGCKFGFFVTRDSWSNQKHAMVIGIDGVEEGKMIEGDLISIANIQKDMLKLAKFGPELSI